MAGPGTHTEGPVAEEGYNPALEPPPKAMNVFCDRCRTRLTTRITTSGDGVAIELVEPCPQCTRPPRQKAKGLATRCKKCHRPFRYEKRRGPPPAVCSQCGKGDG